ncbi:hypothetical protein Lalb_Chr00c24g0407451 (mitochondrion) [Lupinus albus]|uniref:Uncharacterized protein n=1 Tax=Lupinus albus TaxID=3870 RepID=A0A6A4N1H2_LUPAL|nr:hypothetical protein Lalb_Chr00c24g0407451 [Lupinus albus]
MTTTLDEIASAKRWLPLEANPDVMNQVFSPSLSLILPLHFFSLLKNQSLKLNERLLRSG